MLGSAVIPYLQQCGHDVYATDIAFLDVRSQSDIARWFAQVRPDLVAHLAAETSLEVCEEKPDHAWLTNAIGTKYVALACRENSVPMAYISSAGIFDGKKDEPYTEFDVPNPINVYGASKLEGERFVRQLVPESYTVRAGWMMGGGPHKDHKFISLIMDQITAGVTTIHGVSDKFGSPTYAPDFAKCFELLITSGNYGTYHMVSPGSCSRYEMAQAIVEILGVEVEVRPTSSTFFASTFFAPRPTSEVMQNYVLELSGLQTMRPWREALAEYLKEWA
jgi:dTDP-4-dehydrorhamnose reductase